MLTSDSNVEIATRYRFQRITPSYILVYGEDEPEGAKYTEITANEISNLSRRDFQWLQDANIVLLREFAEEHKDAQRSSFRQFLEELDKNIEDELKDSNGERESNQS